jgi:protein-S-isoprenylcysteine O-methyltransferase Ste14
MVAGLLLLLLNRGLLSPHPAVIGFQLAAVALMIWARRTFGRRSFHLSASPTEGGLVTSGPYRFIRHPIYASILLLIWAGLLANVSIPNLLCGMLVLGGALVRILCEEHLVRMQYPEYEAYAASTKRLIPFVF